MRSVDRTAAGFEVLELSERVRLLTATREDLAWKALLDQVHVRSKAVVQTLLSACRPSTLRHLVDRAGPSVSTHRPEDCVGELGVQLVIATLRRHLGKGLASSPGETGAAGASEHFGLYELRRHRAESRRTFHSVKAQLWASVVAAALREAAALVVRVEGRYSEAEVEAIRSDLANAFEKRPDPLEVLGSELREVAEYVAAVQVLARLGRRAHRAPAPGDRPQRGSERPVVREPRFEPTMRR